MPDLPLDLADDENFEMANLTVEDTGIEGWIYISTKQGSHAPRIKYYAGRPTASSPCNIISIMPTATVIIQQVRVDPAVERQILTWVAKNSVALTNFWYNGNNWTIREVFNFTQNLQKV